MIIDFSSILFFLYFVSHWTCSRHYVRNFLISKNFLPLSKYRKMVDRSQNRPSHRHRNPGSMANWRVTEAEPAGHERAYILIVLRRQSNCRWSSASLPRSRPTQLSLLHWWCPLTRSCNAEHTWLSQCVLCARRQGRGSNVFSFRADVLMFGGQKTNAFPLIRASGKLIIWRENDEARASARCAKHWFIASYDEGRNWVPTWLLGCDWFCIFQTLLLIQSISVLSGVECTIIVLDKIVDC